MELMWDLLRRLEVQVESLMWIPHLYIAPYQMSCSTRYCTWHDVAILFGCDILTLWETSYIMRGSSCFVCAVCIYFRSLICSNSDVILWGHCYEITLEHRWNLKEGIIFTILNNHLSFSLAQLIGCIWCIIVGPTSLRTETVLKIWTRVWISYYESPF